MTKPRFTPDPLPDGLDPTLASYLQRQFDRIDDWWPKDLEDRVKALEEIASGIGGIWPIVDYSAISFGAVSLSQVFSCGLDVTLIETLVHPDRTSLLSDSIVNPSTGMVWMVWGFVGYDVLVKINPEDDSTSKYSLSGSTGTVAQPFFASSEGTVGQGDFVLYVYNPFATDLNIWSLTSGTPVFFKNRTKPRRHQFITAESETHLFFSPSGSVYNAGVARKDDVFNPFGSGDVTVTSITLPLGYDGLHIPACYAGNDDFILLAYNSSLSVWSTFHLDSALNVTGPIESISAISSALFRKPGIYTPYGCVFAEYIDTNIMAVQKINFDGTIGNRTELVGYPVDNDHQYNETAKYNAALKSIFYVTKENPATSNEDASYIVKYNAETDGVESCEPNYIGTYPSHYGCGGIYANGKCYIGAYQFANNPPDESQTEIFSVSVWG